MKPWPELDVARWAGTKRSLHLYAQMLGKMRVALSPAQPNWMHTALYLYARGITTAFIPAGDHSFEAVLDVFDSRIVLSHSNGQKRAIDLVPVRTIAEVYREVSEALNQLQLPCRISPVPQELPDTTPFDRDDRPSEYDPAAVQRWFEVVTALGTMFEAWRQPFFGRSGIQLWWGAFDFAVMLFSGKRVAPPTDRGFIMKYDLDAQLMNVGFYLGDESNAPFFYGYIYPEPQGAATLPIPSPGAWNDTLHEWVLPYDAVRSLDNRKAAICDFIDWIYEQCFSAAGWTRENHEYDSPP